MAVRSVDFRGRNAHVFREEKCPMRGCEDELLFEAAGADLIRSIARVRCEWAVAGIIRELLSFGLLEGLRHVVGCIWIDPLAVLCTSTPP